MPHNLQLPPRHPPQNNAILSTLALAWAEHSPALHSAQIWAYLHKSGGNCFSFQETRALLAELEKEGIIYTKNGRYSLERSLLSFEESVHHAKISAQKIRRARGTLSYLCIVPFIKAAAFTGSVAFGSAKEKSDVDIACVAQEKRIWTARMGTLILGEFLGVRREKAIRAGKDKLCFNYFVTPDAEIPVQNIASAHMLARAIPFFGEDEYARFLATQKWIKEYLRLPHDAARTTPSAHLPRAARPPLTMIKTLCEKMLAGKFGDTVEKICKTWQLARLSRKIASGGDASHFITNDTIIALHHPRPKNKEVMKRYRQKMKELGLL